MRRRRRWVVLPAEGWQASRFVSHGGWSTREHGLRGGFRLPFRGLGWVPHQQVARPEAHAHPATLLQGMGQLVGKQLTPARSLRRILPCAKHQVLPHRVGYSLDGPSRLRRPSIRVDSDPAKIMAEAGLEESARSRLQGLARRAQHIMNDRGGRWQGQPARWKGAGVPPAFSCIPRIRLPSSQPLRKHIAFAES